MDFSLTIFQGPCPQLPLSVLLTPPLILFSGSVTLWNRVGALIHTNLNRGLHLGMTPPILSGFLKVIDRNLKLATFSLSGSYKDMLWFQNSRGMCALQAANAKQLAGQLMGPLTGNQDSGQSSLLSTLLLSMIRRAEGKLWISEQVTSQPQIHRVKLHGENHGFLFLFVFLALQDCHL